MVFLPELLIFVGVFWNTSSKCRLGLSPSWSVRARTDTTTWCALVHEPTVIEVVVIWVVVEHVFFECTIFFIHIAVAIIFLARFVDGLLARHGLSCQLGLSCSARRLGRCWDGKWWKWWKSCGSAGFVEGARANDSQQQKQSPCKNGSSRRCLWDRLGDVSIAIGACAGDSAVAVVFVAWVHLRSQSLERDPD